MKVTIQANTQGIQEGLAKLSQHAQNLNPALDSIGSALAESIRLSFRASQDPYSNAWAALTQVTLSRRKKGGEGAKPLLDTGILRNSISHEVQGNTVEVGTGVEYAPLHQFGAQQGAFGTGHYKTRKGSFPIPWGNVPARPFLPIQNGQVKLPAMWANKIESILANHLKRALV